MHSYKIQESFYIEVGKVLIAENLLEIRRTSVPDFVGSGLSDIYRIGKCIKDKLL